MEIPAKVSLYCPLIDAKGSPATLVAVNSSGYYQLEISVKGQPHTLFVPLAHAAVLFTEPEPERDTMEIER